MAEHDPALVEKAAEAIARADGYMTDAEARSCARAALDAVVPAIQEAAYTEASGRVSTERDGHLASPGLDPAWVAGWHSAVDHLTHRLSDMAAQQREERP